MLEEFLSPFDNKLVILEHITYIILTPILKVTYIGQNQAHNIYNQAEWSLDQHITERIFVSSLLSSLYLHSSELAAYRLNS